MDKSRSATGMRRTLFIMSPLMALISIGFVRVGGSESMRARDLRRIPALYDPLLHHPLSSYPSWIGYGWLPLDFVVGTAMAYVMMSALANPLLSNREGLTREIGIGLTWTF